MASTRATSRSGFTLVELLVVLAVIAIFVGVFATALRPGSPTVAVEGGQSQVASLLTQARGVAVLKGSPTRLIIHADPDNRDRFLRFAGIVYRDEDTGEWEPAMDGITLPNGVYFVPPAVPGADGVGTTDDDWDSRVVSRFSDTDTEMNEAYISNEGEDYYYVEFDERGLVPQDATSGSPIVSVATGQPGSDGAGVNFDNSAVARGAILRQYGSFVLLNSESAYPTS